MMNVKRNTTMKEIADIFNMTGENNVMIELGEQNEDGEKVIEIELNYSTNRKKYYLSVSPIDYKNVGGVVMRSFMMFSGCYEYLNNEPIARKSPKQEKMARAKITEDLLADCIKRIGITL